jgi:transcriptional repressor NrdR
MRCPFCNEPEEKVKVIDSRSCENGRAIRRRRRCENCKRRFTTYERIEQTVRLMVTKKDGRRVPWDKRKIIAGLDRACFKRPVDPTELQRLADEVEEEVFTGYDREVPSAAVGELVADRLRRLDQVAYVRFASVYRQFKTLGELVDEAKAVLDARRFEDPQQGRLFVDTTAAATTRGAPPATPAGDAGGPPGAGASTSDNGAAGPAAAATAEVPAKRVDRRRRAAKA